MIAQILQYVMVAFMVLGAIDKAFLDNKLGFGKEFEEGINAMGPLAMSMVGMMCFAPVIGSVLTKISTPIFNVFGADPAMLPGTIFALDMGGYPLAMSMTTDPDIVALSGIYLGAMLGATIIFAIPVSLGIVPREDREYLAKGVMIGIVSVPFGVILSGILGNISISKILINLFPTIIFSAVIILGIIKNIELMIKIFDIFAKFITAILTITFAIGIFTELTGIVIVEGIEPIGPQLEIVGYIAITLAGAYPFVSFLTKRLSAILSKGGKYLGINDVSMSGLITVLANSIPMYAMVKDMDNKGKIMTIAFSVCAATAFGDHLAYVSANDSSQILPTVAGKLFGGLVAIILVEVLTKINKDFIK